MLFSSIVLVVATLTDSHTPLPQWVAPQPDGTKPLGGFTQLPNVTTQQLVHGDSVIGGYNHAAMLDYHNNQFVVMWKNAPQDEDEPGQRILYTQSVDGPTARFNGRLFAAASPWPSPHGAQFCLWPEPVDPRDSGPPGQSQPTGILMMREILPGIGNLGQLFWTSDHPPSQYAAAAAAHNVTTLKLMDSETRNDLAVLSSKMESVPCAPVGSETLKCEACAGGCQKYADISTKLDLSNERTHYVHPTTKADLLLYRSHSHALFASVREAGSDKWSKPLL
eukprot:gene22545-11964_t